MGQAGGGTSRRVTRRGQPPPPPSPSALRETTGVTCAQCNHKKAKCASSAELEMMGRGVRMASRSLRPTQLQLAIGSLNAQRTTHTYTHTPTGEKMVPCDRCWRLELPCRPYLRAAGGGAEPRELMSAADEVAERVLGCTDLGALAEQMAGAFRLGEVDPTRAGALL